MDTNRTNLKVAIIMAACTIAVAFVLYTVFNGYMGRKDPATLQAEALLVEAQAKEHEGESSIIQAKANLVSAYPDTITAAGETALQFGLGLFLTLVGLGAAWLIFSIGTSFIVRSSANAYRDVNAIRVLPELQIHNDPQRLAVAGVAGYGGVDSQDMDISTKSAGSGAGGAEGARARYAEKSGSVPDPGNTVKKRK